MAALTKLPLAYVAGIVDGEGCIQFTKSRSAYVPRVMVTNTDRRLLDALANQFGGWLSEAKHGQYRWKRSWHWVLANSAAVDFVERIEPWLMLKREQVWLLYAWDCIRPGYNRSWTAETRDALALLVAQSHWLNRKGPTRAEKSPIDLELEDINAEQKQKTAPLHGGDRAWHETENRQGTFDFYRARVHPG